MGHLIVLIGHPGAGKSTLVAKWRQTKVDFDYFELDVYFDVDYANEKSHRQHVAEKVKTALNESRVVVVDDTNHLSSMRHFWACFRAANAASICIFAWLTTPLDECIERNEKRTNRRVPNESMVKIGRKFETPGDAYFEANLIKIDDFVPMERLLEFDQVAVVKRQERRITAQGTAHAIDQALRTRINVLMSTCPAAQRKELSTKLRGVKTNVAREADTVDVAMELFDVALSHFTS